MLCFRSATVLLTQSFTCYWAALAQGQGLLYFPLYNPRSHLGLGKRMRGHTARTADLNRLKKYSTPCNVTLSNQTGVGVVHKQLLLGDWLGIDLLVNDCLCFCFVFFPYLLITALRSVFLSFHCSLPSRASNRVALCMTAMVNPPQHLTAFSTVRSPLQKTLSKCKKSFIYYANVRPHLEAHPGSGTGSSWKAEDANLSWPFYVLSLALEQQWNSRSDWLHF